MSIKQFYIDNIKMIKKCWINMVAISFFGLFVTFPTQAIASKMGGGDLPVLIASIFAILFYFFVIYDAFWEFGGNCQNKNSEKYRTPFQCMKMGFCAYLPLLMLIGVSAVFLLIFNYAGAEWAGSVCSVINLIVGFIFRGMYLGIKYFLIGNDDPAAYKNAIEYAVNIASLIPMPLICYIAFRNGQNNVRLIKKKDKKEPAIKKEKLK